MLANVANLLDKTKIVHCMRFRMYVIHIIIAKHKRILHPKQFSASIYNDIRGIIAKIHI